MRPSGINFLWQGLVFTVALVAGPAYAGGTNNGTIFSQQPLPEKIVQKIKDKSWKTPAPIKLADLVYLKITHLGFDAKPHVGEMIVNKRVAGEVLAIFKDLYQAKYPIEKIRLIDEYNAGDDLSMADNNSSALCVRPLTGETSGFSRHSYGLAIDINPVQNPYVKNGKVLPSQGKDCLDRSRVKPGMIIKGDACYKAFASRGWQWGGAWKSLKDYQHFEKD